MATTNPAKSDDPDILSEIYNDIVPRNKPLSLPQRVRDTINKQDATSEVLIKIMQLMLVGFFGFLYFLSPKTDTNTEFTLVPLVLTLYLILTIIGLIWSIRTRLPDWAVYISIFFDIGLLILLILSFHIQYGQPASFSLKTPTFLYIFLFIALRALRFQPRFVLAAGAIGAIGWVMMIVYVININPENTMITRNYITYLTSNSILIGAEIDKIMTILAVSGVLAMVLYRGQRLLFSSVEAETAAKDLSRFLDGSVAEQIRSAEQQIAPGQGIKREAAVVNVDIRGFSLLAAEIDPSEVVTILGEYQTRIIPILLQHNGSIDKFLGDGIMATFGAVQSSETYAADALRAVDDIMTASDDWAAQRISQGVPPLAINASVAVGPIVFGAIGGEERLEYTVIGSTVNLSAKLEKHNKQLGVRALATQDAYTLAKDQGYDNNLKRNQVDSCLEGFRNSHQLIILDEKKPEVQSS